MSRDIEQIRVNGVDSKRIAWLYGLYVITTIVPFAVLAVLDASPWLWWGYAVGIACFSMVVSLLPATNWFGMFDSLRAWGKPGRFSLINSQTSRRFELAARLVFACWSVFFLAFTVLLFWILLAES